MIPEVFLTIRITPPEVFYMYDQIYFVLAFIVSRQRFPLTHGCQVKIVR